MGQETLQTVTPINIKSIDHIEFCTEHPAQVVELFELMGFVQIAYAGRPTGRKYTESYVLQQGNVRVIISGPMRTDSFVARFVRDHGDGVRDIAFEVANIDEVYRTAILRGADSIAQPEKRCDEYGHLTCAVVRAPYGEVVHTFIDRSEYRGPFAPGFVAPIVSHPHTTGFGIKCIDHIVANVGPKQMEPTAAVYNKVYGLQPLVSFSADQIKGKYTALMSMVMWDGAGILRIPINEPTPEHDERESQISEFLRLNGGAGIQHIALQTDDIVKTVSILAQRGIPFLSPSSPDYYERRKRELGDLPGIDIEAHASLGILLDRDEFGSLSQIFTSPLIGGNGDKGDGKNKTMFFEFIQRREARGFGEGNFGELFVSMENDQIERAAGRLK